MTEPTSPTEALLVHADFVRRVAAALVGRDRADDLCQETWVAALQRPPLDGSAPRSWLATVVRNLFRNQRRADARRTARERDAAAASSVPPVEEIVAREELRRGVVTAVLHLPAELRDVVLLRFYEGLDSRAIGARLGRPAGTVRWQLHSALQQLRGRLDGEHGEQRAAWTVPLAGWLRALPAPVVGLLRVVWPVRAFVTAVALLVIAVFTVPGLLGPGGGPTVPLPLPVAMHEQPRTDAPAANTSERTAVAANLPADAAPAHGPEDLWGRVVTAADDRPVADAEVQLQRCDADEFDNLDLEYGKRTDVLATTRTESTGSFEFRVKRALHHRLLVRAAGFPPVTAFDCTGGAEFVVRVARGAIVEGMVMEATTRAGLAKIPVTIHVRGKWDQLAAGETANDGSFRFENLTPCSTFVIVRPPDLERPPGQDLDLVAGGRHRLEFTVALGRMASGIVTDAGTGTPVGDAEISDSWTFDRLVRTRADGHYEFPGLRDETDLLVRARGFARQVKAVPAQVPLPVADFALARGGSVRGRFVDGAGAPLGGIYAAVGTTIQTPRFQTDWLPAVVARDGRFRVEGLDSTFRYEIYARGQGLGARVYVLPRSPADGEVLDIGDVTLLPGALLEGRAVDGQGRPLAAAELTLSGENADACKLLNGLAGTRAPTIVHQFAWRSTHTAGDGSFRFAGLAGGTYELIVQPAGARQTLESGPYELRDGEVHAGIEVVVDCGVSIAGTVHAAGLPALPDAPKFVLVAMPKNGRHQTARVAGDGTFHFERLDSGEYVLSAMFAPAGYALVPVRGVAAGSKDLDLVLQPAEIIEGKVVDPDGKPARVDVCCWPGSDGAGSAEIQKTDADGHFRLEVPPGFVGKITANDPENVFRFAAVENVAAGTHDLVLKLEVPKPR